jgi:catechol 2,3-dioxygenase-like lactoylglutathione lyase family enzyme
MDIDRSYSSPLVAAIRWPPVGLPARISAVTLVCQDLGRMAAFYRQFDWPEAPTSVPEHVVFQCSNGVVLGLFSEARLERQFGRAAEGFRGFTLTIHCDHEEAVVRAHQQLRDFDDVADLDPEPTRSGWGYGFSFRDPEANVWGVAVKYGSHFDDRGGFIYP